MDIGQMVEKMKQSEKKEEQEWKMSGENETIQEKEKYENKEGRRYKVGEVRQREEEEGQVKMKVRRKIGGEIGKMEINGENREPKRRGETEREKQQVGEGEREIEI